MKCIIKYSWSSKPAYLGCKLQDVYTKSAGFVSKCKLKCEGTVYNRTKNRSDLGIAMQVNYCVLKTVTFRLKKPNYTGRHALLSDWKTRHSGDAAVPTATKASDARSSHPPAARLCLRVCSGCQHACERAEGPDELQGFGRR